jgi:hypothetical protein
LRTFDDLIFLSIDHHKTVSHASYDDGGEEFGGVPDDHEEELISAHRSVSQSPRSARVTEDHATDASGARGTISKTQKRLIGRNGLDFAISLLNVFKARLKFFFFRPIKAVKRF